MTVASQSAEEIARDRTAISRSNLSAPLQTAGRYGYLDGTKSVFDYGCGRGHDIAILETAGIRVSGWDPHYRPGEELKRADVVNLGYVLNVIEDGKERREALEGAAALANQMLIVSVISSHSVDISRYRKHGDGVVTDKGTFQCYFLQHEIKAFIEEITTQEAIAVGQGLFFVFFD